MKTCSKCKEEKSVEDFSKNKKSPDGLQYSCKACQKVYDRELYQANRGEVLAKRKVYRKENREKISERSKDYYAANREKIAAQHKCYYQANREETLERNKAYRATHREEKAERERNRRANDPIFLWVSNTRTNLHRILNGKGNHAPTLELLGCTGEEWRAHLESTFKPGMTWENYGQGEGKWEIDHIAPVSSFDQENHLQRLICWNFKNTQALWSHENMAKGDTLPTI